MRSLVLRTTACHSFSKSSDSD